MHKSEALRDEEPGVEDIDSVRPVTHWGDGAD